MELSDPAPIVMIASSYLWTYPKRLAAQTSRTGRLLSLVCLVWLILFPEVLRGQATASGLQQVTLGWNASLDLTVVGYILYYGSASGVYTNQIDVGTNTVFSVGGLVAGSTYYFSATSYTAAGTESSYVPEVSYVVPGILTLTQDPASAIMRVQFPVAPSQSYQLQVSSDLKSWSNLWLTPIQTTNAWVEYSEPLSLAIPSRFYRLSQN